MSGDKENGLRKPDGSLIRQLELYRDSGYYPFHMPGHKRNMPPEAGEVLQAAAGLDITEIDGFDDLHQPEGILHLAQERAAEVFGADETFFSGERLYGRDSDGSIRCGQEGRKSPCGEELS